MLRIIKDISMLSWRRISTCSTSTWKRKIQL